MGKAENPINLCPPRPSSISCSVRAVAGRLEIGVGRTNPGRKPGAGGHSAG